MAKNISQQVKSLYVVGDNEEHHGKFAQHDRNYHLCVPLEVSDHGDYEVASCFSRIFSAALLQEQISCYVCSEIPLCAPCIVCESTGKTLFGDWLCSCCNADNVRGVSTDEAYKGLTQKRYQAAATSEEDFESKDGDVREKYSTASCLKEFLLNFPCITLFTNFPMAVNFCYPLQKSPDGNRMGTPLMEYKCIFWLCEHPTKVFCPPCVGCVKPWRHCVYTCDEAPSNETAMHIMDGEPKCFYCVPNHDHLSPCRTTAAFMCPCIANMWNMEQIFIYEPPTHVDRATGELRLPMWNRGQFTETYDGEHPSGETLNKRRAWCAFYSFLCCAVPFVGHAIARTQIQQALFPVEKNVNNVLKHKNVCGNLCCDVLFPCCAAAQETYAIALEEQNYANTEQNQSTWEEQRFDCLTFDHGNAGAAMADSDAPQELEMTARNE
jgi:hypothetical protein